MTREVTSGTDMTVVDLFRIMSRYRWLILLSTTLLVLISGGMSALRTPLYSAKVVMVPATGESDVGVASRLAGSLGGLVGLANLSGGSGAAKEEALAMLKSRRFTEEFIIERNLLPELFPDLWNQEEQHWIDSSEVPSMGSAFRRFDQHIRFVSQDKDTGILNLEVIWRDPERAAVWANDLVVRINDRMREIAIRESENSLQYLNDQLEKVTVLELRQAIFGLMERHINRVMLAKMRPEFAFKVIDPAVPAELGNYVSPRPVLAMGIGGVLGFMLGIMGALGRFFYVQERHRSAERLTQ